MAGISQRPLTPRRVAHPGENIEKGPSAGRPTQKLLAQGSWPARCRIPGGAVLPFAEWYARTMAIQHCGCPSKCWHIHAFNHPAMYSRFVQTEGALNGSLVSFQPILIKLQACWQNLSGFDSCPRSRARADPCPQFLSQGDGEEDEAKCFLIPILWFLSQKRIGRSSSCPSMVTPPRRPKPACLGGCL